MLLQRSSALDSSPQTGRFIKVGNDNIFIQETGPSSGPAVFFIHGTGSWSELWKPEMSRLSSLGFYCIALDLPPFGFSFPKEGESFRYARKSQAQSIIDVLDALNIKKVTLVGHSFGGRATLTTALMIPSRIDRLILVNIALSFGPKPDILNPSKPPIWLQFALENEFLRSTFAAIGTFPPLTKAFVSMFVADPSKVTSDVIRMYQRPLGVTGKTRQMGDWLKEFLLSTENELVINQDLFKDFAAPTDVIWGDLDTVTLLWQGEEIKKRFKTAHLHTINNVGHLPMIEAPESFHATISEILNRP